jgi:mannan endo-1,6-alpha-mannosidase
MWDWMASTPNLTPDYQVNDGSAIRYNCTDTNHDQWSYNYGTMIMGSAYMYTIVSPPPVAVQHLIQTDKRRTTT